MLKRMSAAAVKTKITIRSKETIKFKLIYNDVDDIVKIQLVFRDAVSWMTALKNAINSDDVDILEFTNNMKNTVLRNAIMICQFQSWESPVIAKVEMILGDLHEMAPVHYFLDAI